MNEIVQIVSTVGFPIAMCLILVWRMREQDEKHSDEIKSMTEALNKNTVVMERLCAHLEVASNENT